MPRKDSVYTIPENLPIPIDDGECNHLLGIKIPRVLLLSTTGKIVDLSNSIGRTVVYCYPRTGHPDRDPPNGWNEIPGARGCTPQSCAFKDRYQVLQAFKSNVFGLSTQDTDYQREAVERLHLPFELLSDEKVLYRGVHLSETSLGERTLKS